MDVQTVMTWLEICGKNNDCSGCCPYSENGFGEYGQCRESLMADAYDLLKEQEAKPIVYTDNHYTGLPVAHCPKCGKFARQFHMAQPGEETHFCPWCGQEVKWDG